VGARPRAARYGRLDPQPEPGRPADAGAVRLGGPAAALRRPATELEPVIDADTCPGYEADPNPCKCTCYGCKHHCSAHNPEPECVCGGFFPQLCPVDHTAPEAVGDGDDTRDDVAAADFQLTPGGTYPCPGPDLCADFDCPCE
jgi:hypothetical protein